MAKLRKMLGGLEDPNIVSLMSLIETQSKTTLANWAITYAEDNFLKIYEKNYSDDLRLRNILSASKEYLNGTKKLNEVKPLIKEGNVVAKSLEENPVAQAACRAIVTACGTIIHQQMLLVLLFMEQQQLSMISVVYQRVQKYMMN